MLTKHTAWQLSRLRSALARVNNPTNVAQVEVIAYTPSLILRYQA